MQRKPFKAKPGQQPPKWRRALEKPQTWAALGAIGYAVATGDAVTALNALAALAGGF